MTQPHVLLHLARANQLALTEVELFRGLPSAELRRLSEHATRMRFGAGEHVTTEGTPVRRFFSILSGTARVEVHGVHRATLGPGAHFGELALLDDGPRTATVVAQTAVATLTLSGDVLRPLLLADPTLARNVIRHLCALIRAERAGS